MITQIKINNGSSKEMAEYERQHTRGSIYKIAVNIVSICGSQRKELHTVHNKTVRLCVPEEDSSFLVSASSSSSSSSSEK
jgi:DNA-binding IclR family transcriptional regulator